MNVVIVSNMENELIERKNQLLEYFPRCKVTEYTDPMVAVKYIVGNAVDIVIADADMRRVNGTQLLKVIRMQKPNQTVILLAEDESMRYEAERLAADGYLIKPFATETLGKLLENLLKLM